MNSPLPHSITLPWHPYLPPPSISTLTVSHLVLPVCVSVFARVCMHKRACAHAVWAHSQWWNEVRWTLCIVLYSARTRHAVHQHLTECEFCVYRRETWPLDPVRETLEVSSLKFAVMPNPEVFPHNMWNLFPPNLLSVLFFLSSLQAREYSPSCHPKASLHTPYVLLRIWESLFHWGERKCSIQFPNLILAQREMVPFFMSLTRVHPHTNTNTHTHGSYPAVLLLSKAMGMHFRFILIFFLFVLSGLLWSMTRKWERTRSESK